MAWLGFVTLLTIYWCFFVAATTGRIGWCLLTGWLLPILALTISFRKGMQVNGLMVLICFVLFLVCRSGLAELRGWNVKQRKKRPVLFWLLYTVVFLLMFYSVAQAQMINRSGKVSTGFQQEWSSMVASAFQIPSYVSLLMKSNYDETDREVSITSILKKSTSQMQNKTKLLLMLTESKIYDFQSMGGANYEHNHVLRGVIGDKDDEPNYWGETVEISSIEDTEVVSKLYKLDETWKPENMNVVGVIYDADTYEVLQVEEIPVIDNK